MSLSAWSSHSRSWVFVLSPLLALLLVYYLSRSSPDTYVDSPPIVEEEHKDFTSLPPTNAPAVAEHHESHCNFLRGMENVFVVLKTGATEVQEKLPVHLQTTLRCLPHYAVFSDLEEEVAGVRTHDTLRNVRNETKQNQPDFGLYHRLSTQGREGLQSVDWSDDTEGPFGKPNNPGWRLDRWKFVPMVDEALDLRPDAKWYVFLEGDSYMVWPNLLAWLSRFDPSKPYYIGSPMQIGDVIFAYSGSGIILSNPAMHKISKYRARRTKELDEYTANNWSGDCVLGRVLRDTQVPLVWSWPMQLTTRVWETDHFAEGYGRRPWCFPAISYHRMEPKDITDFYDFEQDWFRNVRPPSPSTPISHSTHILTITNRAKTPYSSTATSSAN